MGKMSTNILAILVVLSLTSITISQAQDEAPKRKVPVPPLIIQGPAKTLAFREEESLEMTCVGKGEPDPEYYWEFNNEPFNPSGNDDRIAIQPGVGTLIFSRPIKRDAGIYQCFAYNKHGTAASVKVDLRLGILEPFYDQDVRTHRPKLGHSLILRCSPPVSFPQPKIIWSTVSEDTASDPVEFTDRISIDPEGNLNFANIMAKDEQEGRSYACIVWNDVMRRDQRGSYQKIIPTGAQDQRAPPNPMWVSPANQRALRGETWRVKCIFSGNPTPRVTWSRDEGKDMPPKKRLESFGQELVLENIQYEDAGKYGCKGENSESQIPSRKSFTLVVEAAPYWTSEPASIDAAEMDTAVIKCEADGKPKPAIKWYINGVPITKVPDDPRRQLEGGTITYSNLTITDAMVFQCNASNKHGYIFSNAYLNVQSEPPTILELPKQNQRVAEGQTVNLTCRVFGSPRPRVIWSKGNEQLTGGNFKVLEDGHLQIEEVSLVDAGVYTCTAINKWDNASASGSLIVRRKTRIQTAPLNVMVYEHTEVKFTCTATTDAEEISNLKIVWKKNGQEIDFMLAQRMFRNNMDNSLTISGTMSLDTAAYTCMATNGLDEDEATAQLVVQGVPDPPEHIYVRCYENENPPTATVEWQPARENYAPILNFIIQYNTTFAPDQWFDVESNVSQNVRNIKVELSPWANYTFRVLARNKIGLSQPGEVSRNVCRTIEKVPTKNPENVIGEGDEPDNLVIFWTPVPAIDQNGEGFEYIVSWRQANDDTAPWETYTVPLAEYYHHIVSGRRPTYTPYEISVKSKNEVGDAPKPDTVIGYSGEDAPLIKLTGITIVPGSLTSTDVQLQWEPIENNPDQIRGFFRGYRIEYWVQSEGLDSLREMNYIVNEPPFYPRPRPRRQAVASTTPKPMVNVYITKLRPYSKINLQVRILNKYYAGPPSDLMEIDTPEGEPGPPRMFEVIGRGPTHFDMTWEAPVQPNGILVGYNISYQTITGLNLGRLQYREEINDPAVNTARLTGLKPNMDYRVYLSAATSAGKGEPMFVDARTLPAGAPDPPTFGFLGEYGETFVDINWVPSRSGNPGSVFYVQYRVRGMFEWMHSRNEALKFTMRITDLDPGTTYQMRVVAKNGMGLESAAEWQEITTGGLAPGRIDLGTAVWFYGIFISLILIMLFMIAFVFAKRYRDKKWEEKETALMENIEERMRQVTAEAAAREMAMAMEEQYEDNEPGGGYEDSDEEPEKPPLKSSYANQSMEEAPPLPEKKGFSKDTYGAQGFHPGQKVEPEASASVPPPAPKLAATQAHPAEKAYPKEPDYPDQQYPEYQYDPQQYPEGYDQFGGYYGEDGQYYAPEYPAGEGYDYGGYDGGYDPAAYEGYDYPEDYGEPQVRDGQMQLGQGTQGGGASHI